MPLSRLQLLLSEGGSPRSSGLHSVLYGVLIAFRTDVALHWVKFAERAMREEGMAYEVALDGSVRYVVDTAFQETASAVINVLSAPPFQAAATYVRKAVEELCKLPTDGKDAIGDIHEAVETVFKVVTGSPKALGEKAIRDELAPIIRKAAAKVDVTADDAAEQMIQSLQEWSSACQKYRHGQNSEIPVEPPLEFAVIAVNNGLGFARWLASFR